MTDLPRPVSRCLTVQRRSIIRTVVRAGSAKRMAKRHLKLVTPATVKRTVTPKRPPNADLRTREYLTEAEVERLMKAAKRNRWGHRDATMVLVAYRHGLRASELVDLRWDQVEFRTATAARPQGQAGHPGTHPILGDELRALRRLQARAGAQVALRVHVGARGTLQHCRVCPHGRAGRIEAKLASRRTRTCSGTPAATRWRTRGTTRGLAGVPWSPEYSAHGAVHRAIADAVQGLLAHVAWPTPQSSIMRCSVRLQ